MTDVDKAVVPIVKQALINDDFHEVIITGKVSQVVLMTIQPGEEIGSEVHEHHDQILVFAKGNGQAVLEGQVREIGTNDLVFVHAGVEHNFINTGDRPLPLYTICAPPEDQAEHP